MESNKIRTNIVKDILDIASKAASNALQAVNTQLVIRNWLIGKRISEEILTTRSNDYGKGLIKQLSNSLSNKWKGFSKRNLYNFLEFYKFYPNIIKLNNKPEILPAVLAQSFTTNKDQENILHTACAQSFLPWSYYKKLISIKNGKEREWYQNQIISQGWSYRVLDRNIKTDMYHRVISNQTKINLNQLVCINSDNYLKSLMIFEFVGFKKEDKYKEIDLQSALEQNMSKFLLELGKGYAFIGKQYHLRSKDNNYFVDLVFYNTILKRYLLIDLKVGRIKHNDIGQMLLYLDLFDKQNNIDEANKSIGMILSSDLNSDIVHYLMNNKNNYVVASKYLTYLPTKEEIRKELEKIYK